MESIQQIKRRIESVKNIKQITKAMELVAATKMRKSQEIALASRPYAITALEILANISESQKENIKLPWFEKRKIEKSGLAIITSDKGLCGAFNANVLRKVEEFLNEEKISAEPNQKNYLFIPIGQKAFNFCQKKNLKIEANFTRIGDYTTIEEIKPITHLILDGFKTRKWDEVIVFSTHFRTALKQDVLRQQIFPIEFENLKKTVEEIIPERGRFSKFLEESKKLEKEKIHGSSYLIEPSPLEVLNQLVPYLIEMQIYHLVLEANASEHAARRTAMKNATDNAEELSAKLTLQYNKSRQAAITTEITEITSGAEAIEK